MLDIPFAVGDTIYTCVDDRSRQGFVIVVAYTKDELSQKIKKIENTIKVSLI